MNKKAISLIVIALFLLSMAGVASATEFDLPKWVIVPEDSQFSDVTLFCGLDAMDTTNNVTPCYHEGSIVNATITFNESTGYPKLVQGRIGNAFEFDGNKPGYVYVNAPNWWDANSFTWVAWFYTTHIPTERTSFPYDEVIAQSRAAGYRLSIRNDGKVQFKVYLNESGTGVVKTLVTNKAISENKWYFVVAGYDYSSGRMFTKLYDESGLVEYAALDVGSYPLYSADNSYIGIGGQYDDGGWTWYGKIDEFRLYKRVLSDDEIKILYLAGRMKLSEPANFRQIFSPLVDLTRDRATFYAGLEVSTSDPSGYVPVPESAVNMSITSAEKLKSDYTGYDFYYQGHYWYRGDKIQFNLPIQFETVREKGSFSKVIILDEDTKTYVYEKEFKVTNPTATKINVIYSIDPVDLGFSVLQYPEFELDGIRMASWQPQNSTDLYLIRTDTLEPGEISTHWIKSVWTLSKEELEFPAKLEDFRNILDWQTAQKLAENTVEGKTDTYIRVIKISSNADVSNVTIYVPLKGIEDESDVVEAVALTGSRETLQVEKLDDGTIAVKVPADAFVSGEAEIKVFYNKETSWWKSILDKIKSMVQWIKSIFGFGGG